MKKHSVKRVIFLILTGVLFMNLFSACGKPKYKLNLDGSFKSKKAAYAAGEKVTVYYDIIGTDTDYSFCSDDVELKQSYSERKGYILSFVMPAHDVTLHVRATNSMMYIPPEPVLTIGETAVPVTWEDNDSVRALIRLKPLTVKMSRYGGFEQVGPLGNTLPSADVQTTTKCGDIVLYSSNQLVIFYGSNSWAYTRLGHIDLSEEEIKKLLQDKDVSVTLD